MKNKILSIVLIIITGFTLYILFFQNRATKPQNTNQEYSECPFIIEKEIFYSGILPKSTSFYDSNNWNLSISQYTDIAIYIKSISKELNDENTIKSLYIDNIKYDKKPNIGYPSLYYQNPLKFATDTICSEYKIDNHLNYNILNFNNEENYNYYSSPNFFTDCSLPITIKYLNSDILKNYKISNTEPLLFNGEILKNSKLNLNDLNAKFSFCINIVSNSNKLYKFDIKIDIPLSYSNYNLFDKDIYLEKK